MSHTIEDRQRALTIVLDWAADSGNTSLAEADLVHGLVEHFGNDGALWGPLLPDDPTFTRRGLAMPKKMFVIGDPYIDGLREWFRDSLAQIVAGRVSAQTRDRISAGCRRIAQVDKYYQPESKEAGLAFVLKLLLDETKGYGADMRMCQLKGCDRFFFLTTRPREPGRRRVGTVPKYCGPEHMKAAHNRVKAAWTKNNRAEMRKAKAVAASKIKARKHK